MRLAEALRNCDVRAVFFEVDHDLRGMTRRSIREAGLGGTVDLYASCTVAIKKFIQRVRRRLQPRKVRAMNYSYFSRQEKSACPGAGMTLGQMIAAVGLDLDAMLENETRASHLRLAYESDIAAHVLHHIAPRAIVLDLEYAGLVPAFASQAKNRRIPIFSMQHGSGNCDQYAVLPSVSDYFFAYSRYNALVLSRMGITKDRVIPLWREGVSHHQNPATEADKRAARAAYGFSAQDTVIMLCLRPEVGPAFHQFAAMNAELIGLVQARLSNDERFSLIFRPHPRDKGAVPELLGPVLARQDSRCRLSDPDTDIAQALMASDIFISFTSSSIVEAMQVGVPSCIIETRDGGTWPDWNASGAFIQIGMDKLSVLIDDIKTHSWPPSNGRLALSRGRFLDQFQIHDSAEDFAAAAVAMGNIIELRA